MTKRRNMTTSDVIARFNKIHGDRYDYSSVEYKSYYDKVKIRCLDHGDFYQAAHHHYDGRGCPKCANGGVKLTRSDVLDGFKKIHGDEFCYKKFDYVNDYTKSIVTCRKHGDFFITPNSHKNGTKCFECFLDKNKVSNSNFMNSSIKNGNRAFLYIAKLHNDNEEFCKIGISTNLKNRFRKSNMPYFINILHVFLGNAELIASSEMKLQSMMYDSRYKPSIPFNGWMECFDLSVIDSAVTSAIDIGLVEIAMSTIESEIQAGHRLP